MGFSLMPILIKVRDEIRSELELDKEYKKVSEETSRLFREIEKYLPEEMKQLIYRYEESATEMDNFFSDALYLKGLQHGIELAVLLKVDKIVSASDKCLGVAQVA